MTEHDRMERSIAPVTANGLGIAGFVCSVIGLCTGGLLSPVGLILSLIALNRPPRGLAIAGVVIGALGSCGIIVAAVFVPVLIALALAALGLTAAAVGLAALAGPDVEAQVEMAILAFNVEDYKKQHSGALPSSLLDAAQGVDPNSGLFKDPWGHEYIFEPAEDGSTYRIYSAGLDGIPATADDIQSEATPAQAPAGSGSPSP